MIVIGKEYIDKLLLIIEKVKLVINNYN